MSELNDVFEEHPESAFDNAISEADREMDNFTGDKVHFEPMNEPSEGLYKVGDFVSDGQFLSKLTTVVDLHIARGAYAQGRQSMRAEVEELKRKDRVTLEEYDRRCEEITELKVELKQANQRWEKLIERLNREYQYNDNPGILTGIEIALKIMNELEKLP